MTSENILPGCSTLPPMDDAPRPVGAVEKVSKGASRRKAAERFGMLNSFVDFSLADLSRGDVATWLVLYRDARDGIARTSQADIARRGGLTDRTVRRAIDRLGAAGLLKVVRRGGLRKGPSSYRVFGMGIDRTPVAG